MPVQGSRPARPFVPGEPIGMRQMEDLEVPVLGSTRERLFVPGVPLGPRPLQHSQVPALCAPPPLPVADFDETAMMRHDET